MSQSVNIVVLPNATKPLSLQGAVNSSISFWSSATPEITLYKSGCIHSNCTETCQNSIDAWSSPYSVYNCLA